MDRTYPGCYATVVCQPAVFLTALLDDVWALVVLTTTLLTVFKVAVTNAN